MVAAPARPGSPEGYGLLISVATPATHIAGEISRRSLDQAGIRVTPWHAPRMDRDAWSGPPMSGAPRTFLIVRADPLNAGTYVVQCRDEPRVSPVKVIHAKHLGGAISY